jgi:hypothetical protein
MSRFIWAKYIRCRSAFNCQFDCLKNGVWALLDISSENEDFDEVNGKKDVADDEESPSI